MNNYEDIIKKEYVSLEYVSLNQRNDPDFVYSIFEKYNLFKKLHKKYHHSNLTNVLNNYTTFLENNIGSNLYNNRDFFRKVLSNYGCCLRFASESIKNDPELVLLAIKNDNEALNYIGKDLTGDRNFIYEASKISHLSFAYAKRSLKNDKEFVEKVFEVNPAILMHASYSLRKDKEFVLSLMRKNHFALRYASEDLRKDEELVKYAISNIHPDSLECAHPSISMNKELMFYSLVKSDFFHKLKKEFFNKYIEQVLDGDKSKASNSNFFGNVLSSMEILTKIYFSYNFTIADINDLEKYISIFDADTIIKFKKNIDTARTASRDYYICFYNSVVSVQNNKDLLIQVYDKYGLNEDNIINFIINNKYLSPECKKTLINISNRCFNVNNIVRVKDIFILLEEMLSRELTLEQILDEKNFPLKEFYKIYNVSKLNNPVLYDYIKGALNMNSIRGLKKHLKKGYMVLDFKSSNLEDYYTEFKIDDINKFIEEYKGTELYDKLNNKFSSMMYKLNDNNVVIKK